MLSNGGEVAWNIKVMLQQAAADDTTSIEQIVYDYNVHPRGTQIMCAAINLM